MALNIILVQILTDSLWIFLDIANIDPFIKMLFFFVFNPNEDRSRLIFYRSFFDQRVDPRSMTEIEFLIYLVFHCIPDHD